MNNEISNLKSNKVKTRFTIAFGCVGLISSAIGAMFTGGGTLFIHATAIIANSVGLGFNTAQIVTLNKQIKKFTQILQNSYDIEKEIDTLLDKMENKIN